MPGWSDRCSASEGGGSVPGGSARDHARGWLATWLPSPHSPPRTQLLSCEGQEGRVLIQVLIEVNAQETQLLLDAFDFLRERRAVSGSTARKIPSGLGLPPTGGRQTRWENRRFPAQAPVCCAEQPHDAGTRGVSPSVWVPSQEPLDLLLRNHLRSPQPRLRTSQASSMFVLSGSVWFSETVKNGPIWGRE